MDLGTIAFILSMGLVLIVSGMASGSLKDWKRINELESELSILKAQRDADMHVINGWIDEVRAINARQKKMFAAVADELAAADSGE